MRTVLNILNFVLGGFFTTLGWLIATVFSVLLVITLPLTRSCWEITKLSLVPFGNEAIHVDELYPEKAMRCSPPAARCSTLFGWCCSAGGCACRTSPPVSCNAFQSSAFRSVSPISK